MVPGGVGRDKLIFAPIPGWGFYVPILRRIPEESFVGFYRKKEMVTPFEPKKTMWRMNGIVFRELELART